jgi:hypothetical protein
MCYPWECKINGEHILMFLKRLIEHRMIIFVSIIKISNIFLNMIEFQKICLKLISVIFFKYKDYIQH